MSFGIYSENLLDQSLLSSSSENAQFPLSNIKDPRRSKVYRSTSNSDSIVFDFQETSEVDSFFIVCDKKAGFGLSTIVIEFNGTNNWGSPAATETITFSIAHGVGFAEFATAHSYRFCRMVMTSALGYCEVANIFLGKKSDIGRSINFGWTYKDEEILSKRTNRYAQVFTDVIARQKNIAAAISLMNKDQLDGFLEVYDRCGESKPFFVRIGCEEMINDYRRFSGMVYFSDVPTISNGNFNKYSVGFELKEAM